MGWRRQASPGVLALLIAAAGTPATAGTCIITLNHYDRVAAVHGKADPAAFCQSFSADFRANSCRGVRPGWSRSACDAYRFRESAYLAKVMPGYHDWSVIFRRD
ncbi:MAG: hypothetical protein C0606_04415 [Hyphomicrobiales bacterium]|nr:MAG: hypothetical protein C0606_04415 [Hyphomicrobiales bacterium]